MKYVASATFTPLHYELPLNQGKSLWNEIKMSSFKSNENIQKKEDKTYKKTGYLASGYLLSLCLIYI